MLSSLYSSLYATQLTYHHASRFMGADQNRMALANQVRPDMTPGEIATVHQMDKALELQSVHSKIMYEVATAMQEAADKRRKQEAERRQRAVDNGSLFV